jgi:broad specificity phosphatase PhoE
MKQLYFVRHGQTEWNSIRRMQGQSNSDLTELGRQQAQTNGQFLADVSIDYLVASPLDRTRQTAAIINRYLQLDIKYDVRIMEWDCGDWSGELWDQLDKKWPDEFNAWRSDPFNFRGPKCENYPDMIDRVTPFLQELLARPETNIAIVSHGVIGRVMVGCLLDMNADEMLSFSQNNDAIMQLNGFANYNYCHFIGGKGPIAGLPPRSI